MAWAKRYSLTPWQPAWAGGEKQLPKEWENKQWGGSGPGLHCSVTPRSDSGRSAQGDSPALARQGLSRPRPRTQRVLRARGPRLRRVPPRRLGAVGRLELHFLQRRAICKK